MLSGGDIKYRLAEVDEVLECLVVQTVEHHEAELERDPLRYIACSEVLTSASSVCKSRDKPRSNLCVPLTTQAAAFSTRCSLSVVTFGALQWSTRDDTNA